MPKAGLYPPPGWAPRQYAYWIMLHPNKKNDALKKIPEDILPSVMHYLEDEIYVKKFRRMISNMK